MKKPITLQLKLSEIVFDIQNKTYLTGRSLTESSQPRHVANMQANDDEENSAQILRSITSAVAVLRNRLGEYLDTSDNASNNALVSAEDDITFTLYMPSNFNAGVVRSLGEAAHQFIVAMAIADWFNITAKGETVDYTSQGNEALKIIEETLCKRSRPSRPGE